MAILFPILAGIFVAIQNIFAARISEKIGNSAGVTFMHFTGLITAIIIQLALTKKLVFKGVTEIAPCYLFAGVLGAFIVSFVMSGIKSLGAAYTIIIMMVSQIIISFVINYFGFFGESTINLSFGKVFGIFLLILGIIFYQMG